MFSFLRGKLSEKTPMRVVIDCNGVGYEVGIPLSTYEKLGNPEQEISLHVHLAVSDDDLKLFGFFSVEEKELFRLLITISGIGPKIALSILSAMSITNFVKFVRTENDQALTVIPGLGKKTAQRLILELKDKLASLPALTITGAAVEGIEKYIQEAESALVTLGYKQTEISYAIEDLLKQEINIGSSEELIKMTIQNMYKKRSRGKAKTR
jgi:Holliday junction DNA helicase RuvA